MSKICIITAYTDNIRWDNYGKCDYGDFASINHHEYSNKHGYSYIKEIVRNDEYSNWHPTWIKIEVLKKYLPLYDYVVWIDADEVLTKELQKEIKEYEQDKVKNTDKALDMIYYSSSELRDIDKEISKPNISKDKLIQLQVKLMNIKYPDDDEILKTVRPYLLYIIKFKLSKLSDQYRR